MVLTSVALTLDIRAVSQLIGHKKILKVIEQIVLFVILLNFSQGVSYPPISGAPEAATGQAPFGAYPHQVALVYPE